MPASLLTENWERIGRTVADKHNKVVCDSQSEPVQTCLRICHDCNMQAISVKSSQLGLTPQFLTEIAAVELSLYTVISISDSYHCPPGKNTYILRTFLVYSGVTCSFASVVLSSPFIYSVSGAVLMLHVSCS